MPPLEERLASSELWQLLPLKSHYKTFGETKQAKISDP